MGSVIYDMSISLDGFVAANDRTPAQPLGMGGDALHEWAMGVDPRDGEAAATGLARLGALIAGRRTYDDSIRWWGADGPTGPRRMPLFVVTHSPPVNAPENGVYTFVSDGPEAALTRARAAADGSDVAIMGGPDLGRQYLEKGLVDEIGVHLVPVLFGRGLSMFDDLGRQLTLETIEVTGAPSATHIRFRIVGQPHQQGPGERAPSP